MSMKHASIRSSHIHRAIFYKSYTSRVRRDDSEREQGNEGEEPTNHTRTFSRYTWRRTAIVFPAYGSQVLFHSTRQCISNTSTIARYGKWGYSRKATRWRHSRHRQRRVPYHLGLGQLGRALSTNRGGALFLQLLFAFLSEEKAAWLASRRNGVIFHRFIEADFAFSML